MKDFSFKQQLDTKALQEENQGIVQYFFFRPHLAALLEASSADNLDIIVLKGAALAETLYPRPSLRPYGDLDILVRPSEAERVRALLDSQGYVVDSVQWEDLVRGRSCQANFFKHLPRGPVVVEMHTRLVNNSLFFPQGQAGNQEVWDAEGLWQRARSVRLAGVTAQVLGPEDQLLHLCLHLAGHYLAAPQSLRDILQVCDHSQQGKSPLNWPLFLHYAEITEMRPACFSCLYVAELLLDAPVPEEVIETLAPSAHRHQLEKLAAARVTDLDQVQTENLRLPLLWHLLGSAKMRWAAVRRILFPSPRWLITHYYYDLFDKADAPAPPWTTQDQLPARRRPLKAARASATYFGVFLVLYFVHGWFLTKRISSSILRVFRH